MRTKRKPSPAQLAARAKFAAAARSGKFRRRSRKWKPLGRSKIGRAISAAVKRGSAHRVKNPAGRFQVTALCRGKLCYLSGLGLSTNREAASNYSFLPAARKAAGQVRDVGRKLGVTKVAVVTAHDPPAKIRSFLLGEAPRAAGEIR